MAHFCSYTVCATYKHRMRCTPSIYGTSTQHLAPTNFQHLLNTCVHGNNFAPLCHRHSNLSCTSTRHHLHVPLCSRNSLSTTSVFLRAWTSTTPYAFIQFACSARRRSASLNRYMLHSIPHRNQLHLHHRHSQPESFVAMPTSLLTLHRAVSTQHTGLQGSAIKWHDIHSTVMRWCK